MVIRTIHQFSIPPKPSQISAGLWGTKLIRHWSAILAPAIRTQRTIMIGMPEALALEDSIFVKDQAM
jgi:hypothetical protein